MNNNFKKYLSGVIFIVAIIVIIVLISERKEDVDKLSVGYNSSSSTIDNYLQATSTELENKKNMENNNEKKEYTIAVLHTSAGDISIELSKDKPLTTGNFLKLAENSFYNGVKFHRVISGFMIQTGDPLSKDDSQKMYWGTGGPGYKFADELTGSETYNIGTVAMANSGPNTNGSQFFIMTSNTPLPPSYTVFGKVIAGQDVAQKIDGVATDASDRPISPVTINSIELK